jgi:hypothetical protein
VSFAVSAAALFARHDSGSTPKLCANDFLNPATPNVVHKAANLNLLQNPWVRPQLQHLLAYVLLNIVEGSFDARNRIRVACGALDQGESREDPFRTTAPSLMRAGA